MMTANYILIGVAVALVAFVALCLLALYWYLVIY